MDHRPDRQAGEPPAIEGEADASRPVGPVPLVAVGTVMAGLVAGLVWSIGRGLQWW